MTDQTREQREAALAADLEASRLIAQANRAERAGLWLVVLLILAFLVGFGLFHAKPADAATRATFKGTVTIVVSNTTKSDPYGQYLNTRLWNLPAAAKDAGIGKYRIVTTRDANTAYGDVYVASIKRQSKVADVFKLVDSGEIWESRVTMSDSRGATMTAAQRHHELVKALRAATPR